MVLLMPLIIKLIKAYFLLKLIDINDIETLEIRGTNLEYLKQNQKKKNIVSYIEKFSVMNLFFHRKTF